MKNSRLPFALLVAALLAPTGALAGSPDGPSMLLVPTPTGVSGTLSTAGMIDTTNPFFQSLGTNGRSCSTCHDPRDGWTVTPASIQRRFQETLGLDPIFRLVDGATSPDADVSTVARRRVAYRMLLTKGLIRVGIGIPEGAEFELAAVDDPYGYASAAQLSLFRRPLPSTNLGFLSTVMWDGRETFADPSSQDCIKGTTRCFASIAYDLGDQANGATLGHAQAAQPLTDAQRDAIVRFESSLYTAQVFDDAAKSLTRFGALGGPLALAQQDSYFGINDVVDGDYRTGAPFDPHVFRLFEAWGAGTQDDGDSTQAREAVARGEQLFDTKLIRIKGVKGLNDALAMQVIDGTCTTCHDTPAAGSHSIPAPLDIGIADASRATPDMPVYVLRNKATGDKIATTDPGRALITGKWQDVGKFKGPVLRALATRAPYFHNGSAADLGAVVDFYDQRFSIGFTAAEKADLVAFLRSL